jgi:hypothetical protein
MASFSQFTKPGLQRTTSRLTTPSAPQPTPRTLLALGERESVPIGLAGCTSWLSAHHEDELEQRVCWPS